MSLVPIRGQTTREPHERPPLGPDEGRQWPRETLLRGSAAGIVLEDWYWCMVLRLKSMGKLITRDKYLSVRQNQGLAWSSDSNLWEN